MLKVPEPSTKAKKTKSVGPMRLGTEPEEFIEVGLQKSFANSDGVAGNALKPETESGTTLSKSALTNFGIDRHQLESRR